MMEDCFWCKYLSQGKTFCRKYGDWNNNIIEKCNKCENKKCELCSNKEVTILQDGKWIPYCDICIIKKI